VTNSTGTLRWADPDALVAAGVQPWMDLPIWLPAGEDHESMHEADVSRAMAAGLGIRPLRETVADTWQWLQSIGGVAPQRPDRPPLGLSPERERELITALIPN
jgi:2'-hydroxyisoflavone reductase